jgi:hypothetical protein
VFQQPRIVVVVWNGENPGHKSIQESNLPLYIPPARYITSGCQVLSNDVTLLTEIRMYCHEAVMYAETLLLFKQIPFYIFILRFNGTENISDPLT